MPEKGEKKKLFCLVFVFFFCGISFATTPQNVQFTSVSTGSLSISWQLDNPSQEYPLMVLSNNEDFSSLFSSITATELGAQTTDYYGLSANTTYYFKVKVSTEPDTNYSNVISTSTKPNIPISTQIVSCSETSCSFSWEANGNSNNTVYYLQGAKDSGFTLAVTSDTAAINDIPKTISNLQPNTTYYFRIKTKGFSQPDSIYVSFGSTITLSNPPSAPVYSLVTSTEITFSWASNSNPSWTTYNLQVSSDELVPDLISTTTIGNSIKLSGLIPNTTYYAKVRSVNDSGVYSTFADFASTLTYANIPEVGTPVFPPAGKGATYLQVQWSANGNPDGTQYYVEVSTSPDFNGIDRGTKTWYDSVFLAQVEGLDSGTTYYFRVKARDGLLRETGYKYLGSESTLTGADITPPSIIDLQEGDNTWRSNSGYYSVYFNDMGSGLSKFQIKITTGPDYSGEQITDWLDVATNINSEDFNTPWQIPVSVFNSIPENTTCYVSVRVYDNNNNVSISTDVFYVLKDTTPPVIINKSTSPAGWQSSDGSWNIFDVDFEDLYSGLSSLKYSASDTQGTANGNVLDWTDINFSSPAISYTTDWSVNFSALKDGITNYISVKAIDSAGNYTVKTDVFKILKNTKGPIVTISSPNSIFMSNVSLVSGSVTRAADNAAIVKTEIALLRESDDKYWSSSDYDSSQPVWLLTSGTENWNFNISTFSFINASSYSVIARSLDANARYSDPYSTFTFTIDNDKPSIFLTTPTATEIYSLDNIAGTANDIGAGLKDIKISVKRLTDNKWWNFYANSWGDNEVQILTAAGSNWSYLIDEYLKGNFLNGFQYAIKVHAADLAYPENLSDAVFSTFTFYDTIAPGPPYDIQASTYSAPGKLTINWKFAGDNGSSGYMALGGFAIMYSTQSGINFSTSLAQVQEIVLNIGVNSVYSYTISSLISDTTYYFKIAVKDDANLWSSPSEEYSGISGKGLENQISGEVKTSAGLGITGVLIEAINIYGFPVSQTYTIDDGQGSYTLENLEDGFYKIRATWIANGIASSVAKDQIPMGYNDVNFRIETDYSLSSISGYIPKISQMSVKSIPEILLYQNSKLILSKKVGSDGFFKITNLLPGNYKLRISGNEYEINLIPGQEFIFFPKGILSDKIYIYPNPAKLNAIFHIETDSGGWNKEISVFDITGKKIKIIKNAEFNNVSGSIFEYNWEIPKLASGVYFCIVKLKALDGTTYKKELKLAIVH